MKTNVSTLDRVTACLLECSYCVGLGWYCRRRMAIGF